MALREITFQEAVFQCELLFVEYFLWKIYSWCTLSFYQVFGRLYLSIEKLLKMFFFSWPVLVRKILWEF